MKLRYVIATAVVIAVAILGVLVTMGPSLSLQTPPIETKAQDYLTKMNFLKPGEVLKGYKATSYYTYDSGVVITDKRVFAFHKDVVYSIPLDKITLVVVKSSALGHKEILISAQADGGIDIELYHADVDKLIQILGVSNNIVKEYEKQDIKAAKEQEEAAEHKVEATPAIESTTTTTNGA